MLSTTKDCFTELHMFNAHRWPVNCEWKVGAIFIGRCDAGEVLRASERRV